MRNDSIAIIDYSVVSNGGHVFPSLIVYVSF